MIAEFFVQTIVIIRLQKYVEWISAENNNNIAKCF